MKPQTISLAILAVVTRVSCNLGVESNTNVDWSAHQWEAPKTGDSRGPCPGLNTLANHGFLPRDGREITIPVVLDAIQQGYNVQPGQIMRLAAKIGLLTTDSADSFELNDLKLHGTLEHDTSLSREDFALGDNVHFNETIFTTLAESNPGVDYYNITSAAQVMEKRLEQDNLVNPNITNTVKEFFVRAFESALYLSVMGNTTSGVAPKKFVQIFFREERLPIAEGWKRSEIPITTDSLGNLVGPIEELSNWSPSGEQVCPWIRLQPEGSESVV